LIFRLELEQELNTHVQGENNVKYDIEDSH
jgi:hypothetical protein